MRLFALLLLIALIPLPVCAEPVEAPSLSAAAKKSGPLRLAGQASRSGQASTSSGQAERATPDQVARRYGLAGELLVAKGDNVLLHRGYGTIAPAGGKRHKAGQRWRLASITKQVKAVEILLRLRGEGRSLDAPLTDQTGFEPAQFGTLTMRQLLTHHSGLANPDATKPDTAGVPAFYAVTEPDYGYCLSKPAAAGSAFAYNNCDYIVADTHVIVSDRQLADELPAGLTMAKPGEVGVAGYVGGKPEPRFQLAAYGAAGGLVGTARSLLDFDRRLMTGKLLSPPDLAELWKPEGNGSYQALGQWVFPGTLKGCAKPKRIVQRDGEIYGVQARNYIFPDDDLVVIVFTNRSSDDFALGEVWEGKGFTYDLLSAAACPA